MAKKDDLLDGMVGAVTAEFTVPSDAPDWQAVVRGRCEAAREALRVHPWAVGLMDSRTSPGLVTLRHHEAMLASLRGAGFSVAGAAHAFALIDSFLYGFALQERNLPFESGDDLAELADSVVGDLPLDEFPHMIEMATEYVMAPGYDFGDEFAIGLGLVLDALERLRLTESL